MNQVSDNVCVPNEGFALDTNKSLIPDHQRFGHRATLLLRELQGGVPRSGTDGNGPAPCYSDTRPER